MSELYLTRDAAALWRADGARFDRRAWRWQRLGPLPENAEPVEDLTALRAALALPGPRTPIAVIGPREASAEEAATATELGGELVGLGFVVMTGGLSGVMEAASRGAFEAGGLTVGLLPGDDWQAANDYVALPLATGIGKARNALIAQSACALIAVGGGYGTLTEIAYGLHFGKPVLTLGAAPTAPGATACRDISDALQRLAARLLHDAVVESS